MFELLSPAGDIVSLRAAVLNGANAVYAGGKNFSARQSAGNLDNDEVLESLRFCHAYGSKLYMTMNTLYNNSELDGALKYAAFLYEAGVDALIIQDIGFMKLLREQLPGFELHASTQMTAHNEEAVLELLSKGFKRVVLSRELSLREIEKIKRNTGADIEVFVHGALCICYSGQCLMSSLIGGRSGNRGRCAQPCRQQYTMKDGRKKHFLSPKDIMMLQHIEELRSAGVDSLKIEGRMKRPEYVAEVTSAYRRAIDGCSRKEDTKRVTQMFNRGGFNEGYMYGPSYGSMMSIEKPKNWGIMLGRVVSANGRFAHIKLEEELGKGDGVEIFGKDKGAPVGSIIVNGTQKERAFKGETAEIYLEGAAKGDIIYKTSDAALEAEAKESFEGKNIPLVSLYGSFTAHRGQNMKLIVKNNGFEAEAEEAPAEDALNTATSRDRILQSLQKTGGTVFKFDNIDVTLDEGLAIPASRLNSLRRQALDMLYKSFQNKRENVSAGYAPVRKEKQQKPGIAVRTGNIEAVLGAIEAGADAVFFGGEKLRIYDKDIFDLIEKSSSKKVYPWYPEIISGDMDKISEEIKKLKGMNIQEALCGNTGVYRVLKQEGFEVYGDRGFNFFNSPSCEAFELKAASLSAELNLKQLKDTALCTEAETMVTVYGRMKLMTNRNCILGSSIGCIGEGKCLSCKGMDMLKDKTGEEFFLYTDRFCMSHIYNSKIYSAINFIGDISRMGHKYVVMEFLDETRDEAETAVRAFKEVLDGIRNGENSERLKDRLSGKSTKGHLERGVM